MGHPELRARLREWILAGDGNWIGLVRHGDLERIANPPALGRTYLLHPPTLVIVGSRDLPEIHHIVEQPDRVTQLVHDFLRPGDDWSSVREKHMPKLIAVHPISNEDTTALPVKALEQAIAFYQNVLGFSLVRRESAAATIERDDVRLGLAVRSDHDPARAGSVALEVDDLDAMHRELQASGARPGEFGLSNWGGRSHRTFFVREDDNGYCYCFYHPLEATTT